MLELYLAFALSINRPALPAIPNVGLVIRQKCDRWQARRLLDHYVPAAPWIGLEQEYEAGRQAFPVWRELYAEANSRGLIWSQWQLVVTVVGDDQYHVIDRDKCTDEAAAGALLMHCIREMEARKR